VREVTALPALRRAGFALAWILVTQRAGAEGKGECLQHHVHGQELRARGGLRAARAEFRACAHDDCPAEVKIDCTQWLSELGTAIPTLVIEIRDADGRDVTDASVSANDEPIAGYLSGQEVELDPGQHKLRVTREDGTRVEEDVVMRVGDRARRVRFTLPRPKVEAAPVPHAITTARRTPPAVYVLGAVAAAAGASFAAFGIAGYVQHRHLQDVCGPSCDAGRVDVVRNEYLISDVSLGVSLVTAGLALFLYVNGEAQR
jgi:hypothetical protein